MFHAYEACTAVGRYDRAQKWLEMAMEHEKLSAGTDSQRYTWFQSCLQGLVDNDMNGFNSARSAKKREFGDHPLLDIGAIPSKKRDFGWREGTV